MSTWDSVLKDYPNQLDITPEESIHIPIQATQTIVTEDKEGRLIFAVWHDEVIWSRGPEHPWHTDIEDEKVTTRQFRSGFPNFEEIEDLEPLQGTGRFHNKDIKWDPRKKYWTYLNNHQVLFEEHHSEDDNGQVEELLHRAETSVLVATKKLATQVPSRPATP